MVLPRVCEGESLSEHTIIVPTVLDECPYYASLSLSSLSICILSSPFADILLLFPRCSGILPSFSLTVSLNRTSSSSSSSFSSSFSSSPCRSSSSRRGSLSFHYYCPILPLTSFFMPLRRSLRCHSNLRWLTTTGIKALRKLSAPFLIRAA